MKKAFLIYPHQLFKNIDRLDDYDMVFLIEDSLYFKEFPFHKQKLILHRASMKAYEKYIVDNKIKIQYIEFDNDLEKELIKEKIKFIELYDTVDDWLNKRIQKILKRNNISLNILETPMFLTSNIDFTLFFKDRKGSRKYFMNDFYIWQRKRLNILVKNNKPVGGKWSFDQENRKKLPKQIEIPETFSKNKSDYVEEAIKYVEINFSNNFGDIDEFWCPVTHQEAKKHFKKFLKHRFELFGKYEDAITTNSPSVFHSTISPLLNNGLLTPEYVIKEALDFVEKNKIPLASLEGFIRQIIGWREYMRAMYVLEGKNIRNKNYFKANKSMKSSFWSGKTGLEPIDNHIEVLRKYAYNHHIPRLMILGNFMNLCGIKPNEVYGWFMEMYIDAYDWVMVPNVYSMTLYADGGKLTTKPYISSSNYILKMSDFKKGIWCKTFDALFWSFVGTHFEKLQKENRLGFIGVQYTKMSKEKRKMYIDEAKRFLKKL